MASLVIEGYRIESELGVQPGVVLLRARQLMQDAQVLLQVWADADARVRDGVRQLAGLRHPGLATVLDIGETVDGRLYVALAGLPGPSLATRLREGIDLEQSCTLLRRLGLVLSHLEQRSLHRPLLHAESILFEASGRPVITRLAPPAQDDEDTTTLSELAALFYEALTGFAPTADGPALPDYLQRWQPIIDGCAAGGFKSAIELLACLDGLEGRVPAPASVAPAASSISSRSEPVTLRGAVVAEPGAGDEAPTAPGAQRTLTRAQASQAATPNEAAPAEPVPPPKPAVKPRSEPATAPSMKLRETKAAGAADPHPARPAAPVRPTPVPTAPAAHPATSKLQPQAVPAAAAADTTHVTAPSRRMPIEPDNSRAEPVVPQRKRAQLPGSTPEPPPPSPVPLYAASAVALLALLGGLWWWLADSPSQGPPPPARASVSSASASATAEARPAETLQARAPIASVQTPTESADDVTDFLPETGLTLDLATLPTVEDPVERFIEFGRINTEAGRLIAPPGRNALERYLLALRIEPSNRQAQAGVAEVGTRCLQVAKAAANLDTQLQALDCVEQVAAAHAAGEPVLAEAMELRGRERDRRLAAGADALRAWRTGEAQMLYAEALRLDPQSSAARSGSEESARQGQSGYVFRDTLRDGGEGPQLRVAAGLGWGRNEVSVDEFRRYWTAAGQATFGQSLPSCRDRESMLRSSRRRSWQAPDFAQDGGHPVVCVNYTMAEAYAGWLTDQTGQRYRLPTRAEWQAVAGSPPPDCAANFRDQTAAQAWNARDASNCSDGHDHTGPAAGALETAGLRGLWGNVAEWLSDCAGNNCRERFAAGGSWYSPANESAPRSFAAEPGFTTIGVRVVRELPARD